MKKRVLRSGIRCQSRSTRRGSVLVLATAVLIMIFGFLAFTADVGYIALVKGQMQNASDAGARAAAMELQEGLLASGAKSPSEVETLARQAAVDVAAQNRAGDRDSVYADPNRDVRLGQAVYDPYQEKWVKNWGAKPYNLVEFTVHRDQVAEGVSSPLGDGPLPLAFAPVIGHRTARLQTRAVSALLPGNGFHIPPGSSLTAEVLPFALDELTWNDLIKNNIGEDNFSWDPETGQVTTGGDGVKEVNLYPQGSNQLPPGNRGTVDFGPSNNSTADLARQILHGVNADDLSYFPDNELRASHEEPLDVNGDPGISNGIKDELEQIIGLPRAIPIFSQVEGSGNNSTYTLVEFVGVRIVDVKMTGNPKRVMIQPAPFTSSTVTIDRSGQPIEEATIFTSAVLLQ